MNIYGYFIKNLRLFSKTEEISKIRIYFIFCVFIWLFSILGIRLFFFTVIPNLFFDSSHKKKSIPFNLVTRRDIVDRNGKLLATNIATASAYANPKLIAKPVEVAKQLKKIFPSLSFKKLLIKLKSKKSFVWIKRFITPIEHQRLNDAGIPGIYFELGERRAYPHASLFSHILGNVGLDSYGLSGIERMFDETLRYKKTENQKEPLKLSLDLKLQNIVKQELNHAIKKFSARGGVGIVQNPNNGEILAMVSLPDFDPYNITKANKDQLFNRATLGAYEVGSVFKPFTVAAALDAQKIRLNDVYDVNNPIHFAKYQIKDLYKKNAWLSVPEILMYSSNIGTAQIVLELGKTHQYNYLKSLGFLATTDIELPERSKPLYPNFSKWNEISMVTMAYGHGISISPLHVVNAVSALVNGGKLYPATILKRKELSNYTQVFKKSTSEVMRKLLRLVVTHGSGKRAEVKGYFVGGKTGTSNKVVNGKYSKDLRVSSFVGAFPIYDPKYVIYVMLDEPKGIKETFGFAYGGWTATPVVSQIIKRVAMVYNIPAQIVNKEKIENYLYIDYNFRRRIS
ncbi:MAG: penicillin-binding protein 2 [Rickettsiales bacterium]|nr:penicillin-binding protein 2 [Rickettsiales bacterium]